MQLTLQFLGVGSAFTKTNFHSNMVLTGEEVRNDGTHSSPNIVHYVKRLLIDCGRYAPLAWHSLGYVARDFDALYLSHLHGDHIAGAEEFCFTRYFANLADPVMNPLPDLYVNETLVDPLWDSLKGGMDSHEGVVLTLSDFFRKIHKLRMNGSFKWCGSTIRTIQTVHVMNGYTIKPSYGLIINARDKDGDDANEAFLTTDTQFCPNQIMAFYKRAKIIFQDCETSTWDREGTKDLRKTGVHAHWVDLKGLPPEIKEKMWLYHYNDGDLPDPTAAGFQGFIQKGQTFEI